MSASKPINLANLSSKEKEMMQVDMAAGNVAYRERYGQLINAEQIEREQPEHLRSYFRLRLIEYREMRKRLGVLKTGAEEKS